MPTRLYPGQNRPPEISPAVDPSWSKTTGFTRLSLFPHVISTTVDLTNLSTGIAGDDVPVIQAISPQLPAQIISGTINGQFFARETALTDDMRAQMVVRVLSGNGTVVRGTLLAKDASALSSEFATADTNRKFPLAASSPAILTPVTLQDGDRIVVEAGFRAHAATSNSGVINTAEGFDDLAEDETQTDTLSYSVWIEFSQKIKFPFAYRAWTDNASSSLGGGDSISSSGAWAGSGMTVIYSPYQSRGVTPTHAVWSIQPIELYGISFSHATIPSLDTTIEFMLQISKAADSFSTYNPIAQIPCSLRGDTLVGYYLSPASIYLPEPIQLLPTDALGVELFASASCTLGGVKLLYKEMPPSLITKSRKVQHHNRLMDRW